MNAHVSSILLGVRDMDRSKRFYTEGLGDVVLHSVSDLATAAAGTPRGSASRRTPTGPQTSAWRPVSMSTSPTSSTG
jgi:hypothetical protein